MAVMSLFIVWILIIVIIAFAVLLFRALLKYLHSDSQKHQPQYSEKDQEQKSFGEVLKSLRTSRRMTQEYVADQIGVSRQAVSKWEQGASEPNASNLLALSRLFGITVDELLKNVKQDT